MKCDRCRSQLVVVEESNQLSQQDQDKCREQIANIIKEIQQFNNYVVPQNFFGPGSLAAYVSPTTTQHFEDLSNVNFDLRIGNEFHGFIRKRKMPKKFSEEQMQSFMEDLEEEIDFYYKKEVAKKR